MSDRWANVSDRYLSQAIERNPSFVGRVIKLLQSLERTPLHHKLLQYFEREIGSLPVARVGNYLDLVHRISLDTEISPVNLLKTLHSFLRYTSTLKTGDWTTGNTLLEICKAVLVTHVNVSIFEPLHALLMFMAVFYSDIGTMIIVVTAVLTSCQIFATGHISTTSSWSICPTTKLRACWPRVRPMTCKKQVRYISRHHDTYIDPMQAWIVSIVCARQMNWARRTLSCCID